MNKFVFREGETLSILSYEPILISDQEPMRTSLFEITRYCQKPDVPGYQHAVQPCRGSEE